MVWKAMRVFVVLLSVTLAFPPQSVAGKSQPKHKLQLATHDNVDASDQPPTNSRVKSVGSLQYETKKHQQQQQHHGSTNKEPSLIRLKRIKREMQAPASNGLSSSVLSKYEPARVDAFDKIPEKTSKVGQRPREHPEAGKTGKTRIDPVVLNDLKDSRIHANILRELEDVNRKVGHHGNGRTGKVNGFKHGNGRHRADDRYRLSDETAGTSSSGRSSSYAHHKLEQDEMNRAAEMVTGQRQKNRKKNKQRNRNELKLREMKLKDYPTVLSRQRLTGSSRFPGSKFPGSEIVRPATHHDETPAKERNRGGSTSRVERIGAEGKHRAKRGQRSSASSAGSQAKNNVKLELERIKRMQRDLMKEITHLERMRTKTKRSVDRMKNQDLGKVTRSKRK